MLSRFVVALVTEELDLSAIFASYKGEKGQPPYHPAMMVALLLYAYAVGIYSSRRIAKACVERVDFMAIVALDAPDFRTISEFRRRHLSALSALFVQVLKLCERAGLVKLGHVALDGTKIKANASKHKAMSYERMSKREPELQAEVDGWLKAAQAADAAEDKAFGTDKRGDEMPDWVANKQARLAKIRQAKAELEAEAKARAAAEQAARENMTTSRPANLRRRRCRNQRRSATSPIPRAASSRPRTVTSKAITHRRRSMRRRRSSWRTRSLTTAATRPRSPPCLAPSRPIWAVTRTKYRPMQATARRPIFAP
jgi:transposase